MWRRTVDKQTDRKTETERDRKKYIERDKILPIDSTSHSKKSTRTLL